MVTLLLRLAPPPPPPPPIKVEESTTYYITPPSSLPPIPETSRLTKTFSYSAPAAPLSNSDFKGYHWLPPPPSQKSLTTLNNISQLSSPGPALEYNFDASNRGGGG